MLSPKESEESGDVECVIMQVIIVNIPYVQICPVGGARVLEVCTIIQNCCEGS